MLPRVKLTPKLAAVHRDFLHRPAQKLAGHEQHVAFKVHLKSNECKLADLLQFRIRWPSTNGNLEQGDGKD